LGLLDRTTDSANNRSPEEELNRPVDQALGTKLLCAIFAPANCHELQRFLPALPPVLIESICSSCLNMLESVVFNEIHTKQL
jgi:preprotein translocase subunit Sec63